MKNNRIEMDDLFHGGGGDFADAIVGDGGSMDILSQFSTYQNFEVDTQTRDNFKKIENLVNSICDVYISVNEDEQENDKLSNYIKSIKINEINVISQLSKQIKISEHLLDTLVRRLDNGGYSDMSMYDEIRTQQRSLNTFAIEFSKYVRGLPEYFDSLRTDMGIERETLIKQAEQIKDINYVESDEEAVLLDEANNDEYMVVPFRGNKALMQNVHNTIHNLKERYFETEETEIDFDPKELNDDDEE